MKSFSFKRFLTQAHQRFSYNLEFLRWNLQFGKYDTLFIGPWMGEVGPEVQYWIPYLEKIFSYGFFKNKRCIVISRGGVGSWYKNVSKEYIELFDKLSMNTYQKMRKNIVARLKTQKQITFVNEEKELISVIADQMKIKKYEVLHPNIMWKEVILWLRERDQFKNFVNHFSYKKFEESDSYYQKLVDKLHLPRSFIAVNFYTSDIFPATVKNKIFIEAIIRTLSQVSKVVYLTVSTQIDDHSRFNPSHKDNVILVGQNFKPRENLGLQSEILRRASLFVGTNGGFSVLPAFLNIPCLSFYSSLKKEYFQLHSQHERATHNLYSTLDVPYSLLHTKVWETLYLKRNIYATKD